MNSFLENLLKKAVNTFKSSVKAKAESAVSEAVDNLSDKAAQTITDKIKDAVTGKKPAEKPAAEAEAEAAGADGAEAAGADEAGVDGREMIRLDESLNRKKVQLASVGNYMNQLAETWNNQKEEGYVYTISLSDQTSMSAMGLANVEYSLNLSCSHVGTSPLGVYRGSMGFACHADYSGVQALTAALAGHLTATPDLWFRNDNFLMNLLPYKAEDEDGFKETLGRAGLGEDEEALTNALGSAIMASNSPLPPLPEGDPQGYWCDWEYRMTEGNMASQASVSVLAGMGHAHSSLSGDGHSLTGDGTATAPFVGTFHEHYEEIIDSPFPYHLKFYPDGKVVLDLYGTGSSTVFLRFCGTWDRIPVGATVLVK